MTLVKRHLRRKPDAESVGSPPQELKIVVQQLPPPVPETPPRRSTFRERAKKALEVPVHLKRKQRPRPKSELDALAGEAERIASTIDKLEKQ